MKTPNGEFAARATLAVVVYLVLAVQMPNFHTAIGMAALLDGAVMTGLVAVGVGLTMIAGELDFRWARWPRWRAYAS